MKLIVSRLQQDVDATIAEAARAGIGGRIRSRVDGRPHTLVVDRIVANDGEEPTEVWLSAHASSGLRGLISGVRRQLLVRVVRHEDDVRCIATVLEVTARGPRHIGFREEIVAPRFNAFSATYQVPRSDSTQWIHSYALAS